jgi:hypothetical protein
MRRRTEGIRKIGQEEMECKESGQKVVNHESESYPGDYELETMIRS